MRLTRITAAMLLAGFALAGCGGGGGGGGNAGGIPTTSVAALISYVQQLIAGSNDTDEPVSLDNVTLPVDDTAEPTPI